MMFTAINTKTIEYDENIYIKYLLIIFIVSFTYRLIMNIDSIIAILLNILENIVTYIYTFCTRLI